MKALNRTGQQNTVGVTFKTKQFTPPSSEFEQTKSLEFSYFENTHPKARAFPIMKHLNEVMKSTGLTCRRRRRSESSL